ncbi:hypothetical protein ACNKHU_21105 [Shigella flexneri]
MGAIAVNKPWLDGLLHPVGAEYRLLTGNIVLSGRQLRPASNLSLVCILAVILFNIVVIGLLRRARSRVDIELLSNAQVGKQLLATSTSR